MIPVFVEGLRRVVAVVCLFAGIWMVVAPGAALIVVRVEDFERAFSNSPFLSATTDTIADFIRKRTEGRTVDATGTPWAAFATAVRDGAAVGFLQRLSTGAVNVAFVYRPDALPGSLGGPFDAVSYVHVPSEDLWLSLSRTHPHEIYGLDSRWAYPRRSVGLGLVAMAFLAVLVLPGRGVPEGALAYSRLPSVVLPDLLGLSGAAFLFGLPVLIVAQNAPGQWPWFPEGGWSWLTWALWFLAAGFLLLNGIAFVYATLHVAITDAALVVTKAASSRAYAWDEMERCSPYTSSRGKIIGVLLIVVGRSPGMVGQGLLVASNTERGLEIRMRDGREVRIMANSFPGYATVVGALNGRGIPGASLLEV